MENPKCTSNLARMRCDGDPRMTVRTKDLIRPFLRRSVLSIRGLSTDAVPKFVILCKTVLNIPCWEEVMNTSFTPSMITRMETYSLSQQLLDSRNKCVLSRQIQTRECEVCGLETAGQW